MSAEKLIKEFITKQKLNAVRLTIDDFIAYEIDSKDLLSFLSFLKNSKSLRFTILTDLFASDFPNRVKRFEVVYSLLSLELNKRVLVKIFVGCDELPPSVTKLFSAACWYEREVFDMFGVKFKDCPDMRRILTDYGFVGHPMRKDFPLTGHLEVKYDEELKQVIYKPVELDQEYRVFDFSSPWQGPNGILPGDEKATK
jgi:NADH-quinone oxidoreductase subunit C